jgi:hypothetical protein
MFFFTKIIVFLRNLLLSKKQVSIKKKKKEPWLDNLYMIGVKNKKII